MCSNLEDVRFQKQLETAFSEERLVSNFVKNFVFCNDLLEFEPLYALIKHVKVSDPQ